MTMTEAEIHAAIATGVSPGRALCSPSGMVHANVGQKLLKRNIFKSFLYDQFCFCDATFS